MKGASRRVRFIVGSSVRCFSRVGFAAVALAVAFAFGAKAGAATLTFESPYTTGALVGQQGWAEGQGNAGVDVNVTATTSVGWYVGGQALSSTVGGATINSNEARNVGLFNPSFYDPVTKSITADFYVAGDYTPGVNFPGANNVKNYEMYVFGWYHNHETPTYDAINTKNQITFGAHQGKFAVRYAANNGTRYLGNALEAGNWYRITATYDYGGIGTNNHGITLTAINLTTGGTPVDTGVNLEGLTDAQFGVDPLLYSGIGVRLDEFAGNIDNISTVPIPEPAACSLLGLASVGLLLARRSRKR